MIIRGNTVGTNMSVDRIAEKIGGTGGVDVMHVYIDGDTFMASHRAAAISSHVYKGGIAYLDVNGEMLSLVWVTGTLACFEKATMLESGNVITDLYFIDSNGSVYVYEVEYATKSDITAIREEMGDISSALDELHTYAQGLITGGGSV